MVTGPKDASVMADVRSYLRRIWSNMSGEYTLPYEEFAESSTWKTLVYRFQEQTGLCSF